MRNWLASLGERIRMFVRSIRFRLTLWYLVILAVILLAFSVFIYFSQARDLENQAQNQLQITAQQMVLLYRPWHPIDGQDPDLSQLPDLTAHGPNLIAPDEWMALVGTDGKALQKVGGIADTAVSQIFTTWQGNSPMPRPVAYTAAYQQAGVSHPNTFIVLVTPVFVDRLWIGAIILGHPLDPTGQLPKLIVTLLLGSLATLALALVGGYWLASRAMSPVRTITRAARGIGETDLNKRLRLGTHDELGELADTFDEMLDRLQAAFDRQRQFTADASHELRTPLTIVSLEADQALSRRRSSEEYERSFKVIKSENEFMAHLVNDLLTLARMDAGQTQLRLEPLDLSDISLDVAERLSTLARRDGVELSLGDFPEVSVEGDRQYLSQMLTNLVENAIKYAGGRGHHVHIETGLSENGSSTGWVRVEDDGPGIPSENLPHLFDRFYRVDKARSRNSDDSIEADQENPPDGSGLGLSIVQWIVHAHGGTVSVESEVGKGSAFEVRLPWVREEHA